MKNIFRLALAVLAVAVGVLAGSLNSPQGVSADITTWDVRATGALENPPVTNDTVSGFARFRFDDVTQVLQYDVTASGASPDLITAAHIHRGSRSVNGPIIYTLSDKGFTQVSGSIRLTDSEVIDLVLGDLYLNIHTKANPGGAARAQVDIPITAGDIVAAFRRFVTVGNQGNIEAILSYFASNAILTATGDCMSSRPCVGLQEIRRYFENALAQRTTTRNLQVTRRGNDIDFRTEVLNDATRAAGIDRLIANGTVSFIAGRIAADTIGFDLNDPQTARFLAGLAASGGGSGGSRIVPPSTGDAGLASE